jgi:threonylcarbamoyladenosine tRNA methylthiotransferase MtaB
MRPGTSAAHLTDNVDSLIKHDRSQILIEIAEDSFRKYRESNIGKHELVLWEEPSKRGKKDQFPTYTGLTSNYIKVKTESREEMTGVIERVKLGMNPADDPKVMTIVR